MFPMILEMGLEIGYAYTSFKWENNAKRNAGVTVVVVSLRERSDTPKYLFHPGLRMQVSNINGYLIDDDNIAVTRRTTPISACLPRMVLGSMPKDGGNLVLTAEERRKIIEDSPEAAPFIKRYIGANEFINGLDRYCLWIEDEDLQKAKQIPWIVQRLRRVSKWRAESDASSTREYAAYPNRFKQKSYKPTDSIIVPSVSSELRRYVPIGYLGADTVISNLAFAIYDAEPWLFALLTSRMHMAWLGTVGGKLETRYRYGAYIVYNNFPVPPLTDTLKQELTQRALRVLDVREYHCEFTLAELYDAEKMPDNLRKAHEDLDIAVDRIYRKGPFDSDEERLRLLFKLYRQMTDHEASAQQAAKPTRQSRRTRKVQ